MGYANPEGCTDVHHPLLDLRWAQNICVQFLSLVYQVNYLPFPPPPLSASTPFYLRSLSDPQNPL